MSLARHYSIFARLDPGEVNGYLNCRIIPWNALCADMAAGAKARVIISKALWKRIGTLYNVLCAIEELNSIIIIITFSNIQSVNQWKNTSGLGRNSPRSAQKSPENQKRAPVNLHRVQCKTNFRMLFSCRQAWKRNINFFRGVNGGWFHFFPLSLWRLIVFWWFQEPKKGYYCSVYYSHISDSHTRIRCIQY